MKLIKFETVNCTPCKMIDMMLKDIGVEVDEKVNVSINPERAGEFGIMKVPVLILVDDNNNEISRVMKMTEDSVKEILKEAGKL